MSPQDDSALPTADHLPGTLLAEALTSFRDHGCPRGRVNEIVVVDYGLASSIARLWLVRPATGEGANAPLFVAHGRGSDPGDSGLPVRFGDDDGSLMTSLGAYRGGRFYVGAHGRALRLDGLDPSDRHALRRHITLHTSAGSGSDYVSPGWLERKGRLGTSEGCFVVMAADFGRISAVLARGGFLYAGVATHAPSSKPDALLTRR